MFCVYRIDHFKTSRKESIFKVENNEKAKLLQQKFASSDGATVSVNGGDNLTQSFSKLMMGKQVADVKPVNGLISPDGVQDTKSVNGIATNEAAVCNGQNGLSTSET